MPSLGNVRVRHYVFRCASEIDTDVMHNFDNSIKVNMEKVFRLLKYGEKSRIFVAIGSVTDNASEQRQTNNDDFITMLVENQ